MMKVATRPAAFAAYCLVAGAAVTQDEVPSAEGAVVNESFIRTGPSQFNA